MKSYILWTLLCAVGASCYVYGQGKGVESGVYTDYADFLDTASTKDAIAQYMLAALWHVLPEDSAQRRMRKEEFEKKYFRIFKQHIADMRLTLPNLADVTKTCNTAKAQLDQQAGRLNNTLEKVSNDLQQAEENFERIVDENTGLYRYLLDFSKAYNAVAKEIKNVTDLFERGHEEVSEKEVAAARQKLKKAQQKYDQALEKLEVEARDLGLVINLRNDYFDKIISRQLTIE
jgi:chromosome segregation ATPase